MEGQSSVLKVKSSNQNIFIKNRFADQSEMEKIREKVIFVSKIEHRSSGSNTACIVYASFKIKNRTFLLNQRVEQSSQD